MVAAGILRESRTRDRGFTDLWQLDHYDPVANLARFHLHVKFHDRGGIRRAFTYDWRLWTIPEIVEILDEAGLDNVEIYWEGIEQRTGFGNSVFRKTVRGVRRVTRGVASARDWSCERAALATPMKLASIAIALVTARAAVVTASQGPRASESSRQPGSTLAPWLREQRRPRRVREACSTIAEVSSRYPGKRCPPC